MADTEPSILYNVDNAKGNRCWQLQYPAIRLVQSQVPPKQTVLNLADSVVGDMEYDRKTGNVHSTPDGKNLEEI